MKVSIRSKAAGAAAIVVLALGLSLPVTPAAAAPRSTAAPFCLLPGSSDSPGRTQICGYTDWQQCIEAAARIRANCVVNIDYRGQIVQTPNGWSAR